MGYVSQKAQYSPVSDAAPGKLRFRDYVATGNYSNKKYIVATMLCEHCSAHIFDEGDPRRTEVDVRDIFPLTVGKGRTAEEISATPVVSEFPCFACGRVTTSALAAERAKDLMVVC